MSQWFAQHSEAVWTLLAGGIIGVFGNWYFYWRDKNTKRLSWQAYGPTPILRVPKKSRASLPLELRFNGISRESPNLLRVRIKNSGTNAIQASDYHRPIEFHFGQAVYLQAVVADSSSEITLIDISGEPETRDYSFKMDLMNAGDWVDIQFVTDGKADKPSVEARLVGETHPIQDLDLRTHVRDQWLAAAILIPTWAFCVWITLFMWLHDYDKGDNPSIIARVIATVFFGGGALLIPYVAWRNWRANRTVLPS